MKSKFIPKPKPKPKMKGIKHSPRKLLKHDQNFRNIFGLPNLAMTINSFIHSFIGSYWLLLSNAGLTKNNSNLSDKELMYLKKLYVRTCMIL